MTDPLNDRGRTQGAEQKTQVIGRHQQAGGAGIKALQLSPHPQQRTLRTDAQADDAETEEQWPHGTNSLPEHAHPLKH